MRVLFIFGTRPEAIKLCPVIRYMKAKPADFDVRVCVTGQHRELLDQVLSAFDVSPNYDLDSMRAGQTLYQSTSRILGALEPVLGSEQPDVVMVQGDTVTTVCGALAGFYAGVCVGHVEAGLRTGDYREPFPEEMNRVLSTRLATLHFAPTAWAASNLRSEGVDPEKIYVTGNTGIDAVLLIEEGLARGVLKGIDSALALNPTKKLIVITAHRRESFGKGIERICEAVLGIARREDVQIVYPVHPNPNVDGPVRNRLGGHPRIVLTNPLSYIGFVDLMRRASVLLTDSGGIQEEGPALGKPVLVMRDVTERPEGVDAGLAQLVGTDPSEIIKQVQRSLDLHESENSGRRQLLYGDGRASALIAKASLAHFESNICPAA